MKGEREKRRLQELDRYAVLDTTPEESFDRITRLAQRIADVPIALVSLVDENRQWFKSKQGLDVTETPREVSFCTHAIQEDKPFIVRDAEDDPRFATNPLVTGKPDIRFYAGIPLKSPNGFNLGTLCVIDTKPRNIDASEIESLRDLAQIVVDELELRSLALQDCLTGLHRRKSFLVLAEKEMDRARRYGNNFSVIALDIDHFKKVNDDYGHSTGDVVLRKIADICRENLRSNDIAARLGGEEFVLLLPETGLSNAILTAERIRVLIEKTVIKEAGHRIMVTTSFGVADRLSSKDNDISSILKLADDRLYEAKSKGRNCTIPNAA